MGEQRDLRLEEKEEIYDFTFASINLSDIQSDNSFLISRECWQWGGAAKF